MKFYKVMFPYFLAPSHLAIDDDGLTICGKNWKDNLCAEIDEIPKGFKTREQIGCKRCILIYRRKYELAGC